MKKGKQSGRMNHRINAESSSGMLDKFKLMQVQKKNAFGPAKKNDITTTVGFFKELISRVIASDVMGYGAQLAYFFLLSFFPLLIFLVTLLPFLNLPQEKVFEFLVQILPSNVYETVEGTVSEVLINRNGGLLSVGILGTIWSASNGINAFIKSLNRSYNQVETRPFLVARFMSVVFTLLLIAMIIIALILPVFGKQISIFLFSNFGFEYSFLSIWNKIRWIITPVVIFLVLSFIYWVAPNIKVYLKSVIYGACFATIAWLAVSFGLAFYVDNFNNYSKTYGSIGGIILLLLWLYMTGIIFMVGGQMNALVQERKELKGE